MTFEQCPHCRGAGEIVIPHICQGCDGESEHHQHPAPQRYTCWTCRGAKVLSGLALAVYKARGGPAPLPMRGFA